MNMAPEFDFQLSKSIRLRGWGWKGLMGLFCLLLVIATAALISAPVFSETLLGVLSR